MNDKQDQAQPARFVARLRGLPWECHESQIYEFFAGIDVVKLKIVMLPYGRSSGEALVEFANEESYRLALGKNRERIGKRYIEVFKSTPSDLDRAIDPEKFTEVDNKLGSVSSDSFVVRMRGLPFSALEDDVNQFFDKYGLTPLAVHLIKDEVGRPTGFCYVEWTKKDEADRALRLNREYMGNRYIEVFESTHQQLERDVKKGLKIGIMTGGLGAPPRNPDGTVSRRSERIEPPTSQHAYETTYVNIQQVPGPLTKYTQAGVIPANSLVQVGVPTQTPVLVSQPGVQYVQAQPRYATQGQPVQYAAQPVQYAAQPVQYAAAPQGTAQYAQGGATQYAQPGAQHAQYAAQPYQPAGGPPAHGYAQQNRYKPY